MMLFSEKYQRQITADFKPDSKRLKALLKWQDRLIQFEKLPKSKKPSELKIHELFFTEVFEKGLGYSKRKGNSKTWNIESEFITDVDRTRPDGVIGNFTQKHDSTKVRVVIELKGLDHDLDLRQNRKQDKRTPVDQAFSYAHKFDDVKWVMRRS